MTPLFTLGLVTLVFNLGGGVTAPALPLYARSLGATYGDLGLIGVAHGLAFAALTIPLGRASDRLGRRRLLLTSALTTGAAATCFLLSTHVIGLVAGKLLEAAGLAAFWPALEAWVAEGFGRRAGGAMGVGYAAYAAAFVVGASLSGFVMEAAGLRAPFAVYLGTATASLLVILAMPATGRKPSEASDSSAPRPSERPGHDAAARRQRLLAYATGFVYVYGLGTVLAFLPAYAADRHLTPSAVGVLLGVYWVGRLLASVGAGRLSDRLGRRAILVPAMLAMVASAALVALPAGAGVLFAGALGLGLAAGACAPTCVGLIADHVRPAHRGMAMGFFEGTCGVAFIAAGFVGGQAADAFGPSVPYVLTAALALGWMPVLVRQLPTLPREPPG